MYSVNEEKCIGCGACAATCPVGAIDIYEVAQISSHACIERGNCFGGCQFGTIEIIDTEEEIINGE